MVKPFAPYVGVSGIVSPLQQLELQGFADAVGLFDAGRQLAFGVKATHKTQYLGRSNKYGPEWFLAGNAMKSALQIVEPPEEGLNVVQVYLDPENCNYSIYREGFLNSVLGRALPWIDALQFDLLPWHTTPVLLEWLWRVKRSYGLNVILQVHQAALDILTPDALTKHLRNYAPAFDCLLFDASAGRGVPLVARELSSYLAAAATSLPEGIGLAVAGGLDDTRVTACLPPLLKRFPNLSWDAEGQLHPLTAEGSRPLNMAKARSYLEASARALD